MNKNLLLHKWIAHRRRCEMWALYLSFSFDIFFYVANALQWQSLHCLKKVHNLWQVKLNDKYRKETTGQATTVRLFHYISLTLVSVVAAYSHIWRH